VGGGSPDKRRFRSQARLRPGRGTSYRFSKSGENAREVRVRVTGSQARLALAYVITLLVSERFSESVESIQIELGS
jgi:CYTH domain-containing protein